MMLREKESTVVFLLASLATIGAFVVCVPLRAWCLIRVYEWHMRPLFGGPTVTLWQAWALIIFVGLLVPQTEAAAKSEDKSALEHAGAAVGAGIVGPLVVLAVAWCLR